MSTHTKRAIVALAERVAEHEANYWHVPKWIFSALGLTVLVLGSLALACGVNGGIAYLAVLAFMGFICRPEEGYV